MISVLDFQADGIVHRRSFFRTVLALFPIKLAPRWSPKGSDYLEKLDELIAKLR